MIGKAVVDTPATLYTNVNVELISDDDVTMDLTVRNRQGVLLEVVHGDTWLFNGDAWEVTTSAGLVTVSIQGGCGCGGSGVEAKVPATAAPGQGYLP